MMVLAAKNKLLGTEREKKKYHFIYNLKKHNQNSNQKQFK